MRFLLVPVADDETLVLQAAEVLRASPLFGPVCEVTADVMDDGLIKRITALHIVESQEKPHV